MPGRGAHVAGGRLQPLGGAPFLVRVLLGDADRVGPVHRDARRGVVLVFGVLGDLAVGDPPLLDDRARARLVDPAVPGGRGRLAFLDG